MDLESNTGCFPDWYTTKFAIKRTGKKNREKAWVVSVIHISVPQRTLGALEEHPEDTKPPSPPIGSAVPGSKTCFHLLPRRYTVALGTTPFTITAAKYHQHKGKMCASILITSMGSAGANQPNHGWVHSCVPQVVQRSSQSSPPHSWAVFAIQTEPHKLGWSLLCPVLRKWCFPPTQKWCFIRESTTLGFSAEIKTRLSIAHTETKKKLFFSWKQLLGWALILLCY